MWILILLVVSFPIVFAENELDVNIDTVAEDLKIPWSIAWTPDGTLLFTERIGNLRVIHDDTLQEEPLLTLDVGSVEGGLLGLAVDPNYSENNYIYLYYTYDDFFASANKVVRYIYSDGKITEDVTIVDKIPGGPFHDGGRIKFGPDGKLYITTGDAGIPELSQDMNSLGGKILRVNSDGTIPHDNPFVDSPIYSLGHRNVQGLDWDTSGNLVATEHGPSGWKGSGHDELNLITPGSNYGWPNVVGTSTQEWQVNPILDTNNETWAPSGSTFYNSDVIPQWTGKYFVATLRGGHIHMLDFDLDNKTILDSKKLFEGNFGRIRDVAVGPDDNLYVLTSNQDGRGTPHTNDDRILRISPIPINDIEECKSDKFETTECINAESVFEPCDVSKENPIFVMTDSDSYSQGDLLRAKICVHDTLDANKVNIVIHSPDGQSSVGGVVLPDETGTFMTEFVLDEVMFSDDGDYVVVVESDGQRHAKTVTVPEFGIVLLIFSIGMLAALGIQKRYAIK